VWRGKAGTTQKTFRGYMIMDAWDSMLLLGLIYLCGAVWHLNAAIRERRSSLWSLLWPLALWLNVRDKHAKRH